MGKAIHLSASWGPPVSTTVFTSSPKSTYVTLSAGNTVMTGTDTVGSSMVAASATTHNTTGGGKYCAFFKYNSPSSTYNDITNSTNVLVGMTAPSYPYGFTRPGVSTTDGYMMDSRFCSHDGTTTDFGGAGSGFNLNDVLGVAVDFNAAKIYFSLNGIWYGSADPVAGTGGITILTGIDYRVAVDVYQGNSWTIVGATKPSGYSDWG